MSLRQAAASLGFTRAAVSRYEFTSHYILGQPLKASDNATALPIRVAAQASLETIASRDVDQPAFASARAGDL